MLPAIQRPTSNVQPLPVCLAIYLPSTHSHAPRWLIAVVEEDVVAAMELVAETGLFAGVRAEEAPSHPLAEEATVEEATVEAAVDIAVAATVAVEETAAGIAEVAIAEGTVEVAIGARSVEVVIGAVVAVIEVAAADGLLHRSTRLALEELLPPTPRSRLSRMLARRPGKRPSLQ